MVEQDPNSSLGKLTIFLSTHSNAIMKIKSQKIHISPQVFGWKGRGKYSNPVIRDTHKFHYLTDCILFCNFWVSRIFAKICPPTQQEVQDAIQKALQDAAETTAAGAQLPGTLPGGSLPGTATPRVRPILPK